VRGPTGVLARQQLRREYSFFGEVSVRSLASAWTILMFGARQGAAVIYARRSASVDERPGGSGGSSVSEKRRAVVEEVERAGIVAIIRMKDPEKVRAVFDAIGAGGVRVIEVTMSVPGAIELIRQLAASLPRGVVLGAGTVLDADTARRVIDAGARFVVSPVFRREVIAACHAQDAAAMPGCFTPTEILDAWDGGADVVKVFPATALGPTFLKDVRGPLPQVKLMPTGGVTLDNAGDWIRAGAVAVGVGTALLDTAAIASGNYAALTANAARIVASVQGARGNG
jgi:2-dehydro-3-deoxyphosphogluconate aldolase/(4S)-4-hydroxy-2-oxoglutarate aldolase